MGNGSLFQQAIIDGDYHPRFVAFYFKQWKEMHMPFHQHDATEIMYMISGVCRIEVVRAADKAESVTLKKGEFILLDSNVPHRLIVEGHTPCWMLNVEFNFVEGPDDFPLLNS